MTRNNTSRDAISSITSLENKDMGAVGISLQSSWCRWFTQSMIFFLATISIQCINDKKYFSKFLKHFSFFPFVFILYLSIYRLIDWLIYWSIYWLIDWLIDWLLDWLIDLLPIDWLIDWLIDLLIHWLIDWLIIFTIIYVETLRILRNIRSMPRFATNNTQV